MSKQYDECLFQLKKALSVIEKSGEEMKNYRNTEVLKYPKRIINVSIPVTMDDGSLRIFDGYRVQHNNILGPHKGGFRFHPEVDLDEVSALSFWMTFKCSVAGIPYGGGKGGITVNPKELSQAELERLTRGYVRALADAIGPDKDIPAPDVYTNAQVMSWFMDEFSQIKGANTPGVVTGKPIEIGGSLGRDVATARGGYFVFENTRETLEIEKEGLDIAIQGFGNAGMNFARIASKDGYKIVAVSDSRGGILNKEGLDIEEVIKHKQETGSVVDFPGAENITNEGLLELEVSLLVPSALSGVITKENANNIKANLILELANGPITSEAGEILFEKGTIVIPDILANSGGVIVSYFEWVQNTQNFYWDLTTVEANLSKQINTATDKVLETMVENNIDMRAAAYVVATKRLARALQLRNV